MSKKNGSKGGASVTSISSAKPAAPTPPPAAASEETTSTAATEEKKAAAKPGPFVGKEVGTTVEYTLPNGSKIQAVVIANGHCACPTCSRRLAAPGSTDAAKVEKAKEREQARIAGLQEEFIRVRDIIAKERARTGQPVLSDAEMAQQILATMATATTVAS